MRLLLVGVIILSFGRIAAGQESPVNQKDNAMGVETFPNQWSKDRIAAWYAGKEWMVGANFVPSTASNQFEMWQSETFDPQTIERELGWAASIGMNTMRVYLHDMLWTEEGEEFFNRIDKYLEIADGHSIKTIFVLFDAVWDPRPEPGPQKDPRPGVHNSRWVQSPHTDLLRNPERYEEVKPYVQSTLRRFSRDKRILFWDLYNEPGNMNPAYFRKETSKKVELGIGFLNAIIPWAREIDPSQPLTIGPWLNVGQRTNPVHPIDQLMLANSDLITFHHYGPPDKVLEGVEWLKTYGRPIVCTEYMSRTTGSTFQTILPIFKEDDVGAINWGLVSGRSQTIYPWTSWGKPVEGEPRPWFHDVFRTDGEPYDSTETEFIRELTGQGN